MTLSIELSRPADGVALVTVNNPPRNQLSAEALRMFHRVLDETDADEGVRCLIVTGTGRSWCAGADLREERERTDNARPRDDSSTGFGALMTRLESNRVPVIGAINGHAIGGGMELALCCDIRIGSEGARFMCAAVNVGLLLSWYRLPRTIGLGPAKQMLLTGSLFDADWAYRNGLLTEIVPADQLLARAVEMAQRIATRAPLSVEATKEFANQAFELDLASAMALQQDKFVQLAASDDHREAVAAFLEKREASFQRR